MLTRRGGAGAGVPSWKLVPVGLVSRVLPKGASMPNDEWLAWHRAEGRFPEEPDFFAYDDRTWEWLMRRIVLEWRAKCAYRRAPTPPGRAA